MGLSAAGCAGGPLVRTATARRFVFICRCCRETPTTEGTEFWSDYFNDACKTLLAHAAIKLHEPNLFSSKVENEAGANSMAAATGENACDGIDAVDELSQSAIEPSSSPIFDGGWTIAQPGRPAGLELDGENATSAPQLARTATFRDRQQRGGQAEAAHSTSEPTKSGDVATAKTQKKAGGCSTNARVRHLLAFCLGAPGDVHAPGRWQRGAAVDRRRRIIASPALHERVPCGQRVSQYLIRHVIYSGDQLLKEGGLLRDDGVDSSTASTPGRHLGRSGGRRSAGGGTFRLSRYETVQSARSLMAGARIYSAAYIMPSGGSLGFDRKHRNHLTLVRRMMEDELPARLAAAKTMQKAFDLILAYPTMGTSSPTST